MALETSRREAEEAKQEILTLKRRSESVARDYDRLGPYLSISVVTVWSSSG